MSELLETRLRTGIAQLGLTINDEAVAGLLRSASCPSRATAA